MHGEEPGSEPSEARDFDDVVRESLAARELDLARAVPDAGRLARTRAAIQARRRHRAALQVCAAGAAAVLVLGVAWGGARAQDHAVADPTPGPDVTAPVSSSPTQSPSVLPSSTPTSSPEPTDTPAPMPTALTPQQVRTGVGLPAGTRAAPADLWRHVGAGWAAAIYDTEVTDADGSSTTLRSSLVVGSPQGAVYLVRELPLDGQFQVARWDDDASRILLANHDPAGTTLWWLDLRTGDLTLRSDAASKPVDGVPARPMFLGLDAASHEVWQVSYGGTGGGSNWDLVVQRTDGTLVRRIPIGWDPRDESWSPDRRLLAVAGDGSSADDPDSDSYRVVDLTKGTIVQHTFGVARRFCRLVAWMTDDDLLTLCEQGPWDESGGWGRLLGGGQQLYRISVDGGRPRLLTTLGAGAPVVVGGGAFPVGGGRVAVGGPEVGNEDGERCVDSVHVLSSSAAATTGGPRGVSRLIVGGVAGRTIYSTSDECSATESASVGQLAAWQPGWPAARVLLPASVAADSPTVTTYRLAWAIANGPTGRS